MDTSFKIPKLVSSDKHKVTVTVLGTKSKNYKVYHFQGARGANESPVTLGNQAEPSPSNDSVFQMNNSGSMDVDDQATVPPPREQGAGHEAGGQDNPHDRQDPQQSPGGSNSVPNGEAPPSLNQDSQSQRAAEDARELKRLADNQAALVENRHLRTMIDTAMEINNIPVDPFHSYLLTELVNALEHGKGVLNEILSMALAGSNHRPGPGELQRALVEADVHEICTRMLSRQALTQEALRAKKDAEQKIKEPSRPWRKP